MKKLFSHITAAMCALFVFACFAICANAAQAAFNVSFNSDMAVGKSQQIAPPKRAAISAHFRIKAKIPPWLRLIQTEL